MPSHDLKPIAALLLALLLSLGVSRAADTNVFKPDRLLITVTQTEARVSITLPGQAPDAVASVLCVELTK